MALIKCPECNKEISDKVKGNNYGYPFEQQEEAQKVEISSVNIKMKKENKKKIIILAIIICCVIVVGFIGFKVYKNEQAKKRSCKI